MIDYMYDIKSEKGSAMVIMLAVDFDTIWNLIKKLKIPSVLRKALLRVTTLGRKI